VSASIFLQSRILTTDTDRQYADMHTDTQTHRHTHTHTHTHTSFNVDSLIEKKIWTKNLQFVNFPKYLTLLFSWSRIESSTNFSLSASCVEPAGTVNWLLERLLGLSI
jgi:hypothetical protein